MKHTYKKLLLTLVILFVREGIAHAEFADVDVTHPHFLAITSLESERVVKGYPNGDMNFFKPLKPVLRSEAMKMLILGANIEVITDTGFFEDVPHDQWYAPFVNTAASKGIVSGFADGNFHPAAQVSRAEFLKMVLLGFGDDVREEQETEDWYERFVERALELNIITDTETDPYHSLTRGELAEILYRTERVAEKNFRSRYVYSGEGKASYYNEGFAGKSTASGEIYDPSDLTAAHRTLPFGTYVKVSFEGNYVIVRINDRGPYHSDRILDLSERAFSELAPISRGVLFIDFEVVSGPQEAKASVPEYIRPEFSSETKNEPIPSVVAEKIVESRTGVTRKKKLDVTIPLFDETITHLPTDFFPNATLRRTIPQKILQGTVFQFAGIAENRGWEKATVFLQKLSSTGEAEQSTQAHFSGPVSGKNFAFPVAFLDVGKYYVGLVFDDERKSRVGEIEVITNTKKRNYPAFDTEFFSDLELHIVPEDSLVRLSWSSESGILSKITFSQQTKYRELLIEDGLSSIELPYSFFDLFMVGQPISVTLSQALSNDDTLANQTTNWKEIIKRNYEFIAGFPDKESDKISVYSFPRFVKTTNPLVLEGKLHDGSKRLPENAFLIMPNGFVKEFPFERRGIDSFRVRITPEEWGRHIFEIVTDNGEILFNRAIYFSQNYVLPIGENPSIPLTNESVAGIRHWTNVFRQEHGLESLSGSAELNEFAQKYAEQMADENFISHTTPTGLTFEKRLKLAELQGEFGENLSFASNLKLALAGFQNSGSHRQNMLLRKWNRVGIGVAQNKKGEYYLVQVFGK